MACGNIAKSVEEKFNIPVITGMYQENPGVDMFRKDLFIIKTGDSAAECASPAQDGRSGQEAL